RRDVEGGDRLDERRPGGVPTVRLHLQPVAGAGELDGDVVECPGLNEGLPASDDHHVDVHHCPRLAHPLDAHLPQLVGGVVDRAVLALPVPGVRGIAPRARQVTATEADKAGPPARRRPLALGGGAEDLRYLQGEASGRASWWSRYRS